jgi:hypothetical protein
MTSLAHVPPRPFLVPLLIRGAIVWLATRVTIGIFIAIFHDGPVLRLSPAGALWLVMLVGSVTWIETRRRHEDLLLGNLGVASRVVFAFGLLPALALESVMAVAARVSA